MLRFDRYAVQVYFARWIQPVECRPDSAQAGAGEFFRSSATFSLLRLIAVVGAWYLSYTTFVTDQPHLVNTF